jgi:hypothetical protein
VDHVLLHYEIVNALWSVIFSRVGLAWVMPKRVIDLFCLLQKVGRQSLECNYVKSGFELPFEVSLEGKK